MFEGLLQNLNIWGDKLETRMCGIEDRLIAIAGNTEAQLAREQWVHKSIEVAAGKSAELRNDSAYGWLIRGVSATAASEVFIGTNNDENFMAALTARSREEVMLYVPPGSIIHVTNTEEGGEAVDGFVNFQMEVLETVTVDSYTGTSQERSDRTRTEPVPSGTPLDTPVAPQ